MSAKTSRGRLGKKWVSLNHEAKEEAKRNNGGVMPYTISLVTSDFPHKDEWSEENLPEILFYIICPESDYAGIKVELLLGEDGKPVYNSENKALRAFDLLPRHISIEVPGWLVESWRRLDPRITYQDIVDRQEDDKKLNLRKLEKNALQNHCFRQCRKVLNIWLEYGRREEPHRREVETVENLSHENVMYNTILHRCHAAPNRLTKIKLERQSEESLYYVSPLVVTFSNVLQTTLPLDHFMLESSHHNMNAAMLAAWEMSMILQGRAEAHGLHHWSKLPQKCLPISWYDRTRNKTCPNQTYDGGCAEVCSFSPERQAEEVEGGSPNAAQVSQGKKRQRAGFGPVGGRNKQSKRCQSVGPEFKGAHFTETPKVSKTAEADGLVVFLESDEEYEEETRATTEFNGNVTREGRQEQPKFTREKGEDADKEDGDSKDNDSGAAHVHVHKPDALYGSNIVLREANSEDSFPTTLSIHGRLDRNAATTTSHHATEIVEPTISPAADQLINGSGISTVQEIDLARVAACRNNGLGVQESLLTRNLTNIPNGGADQATLRGIRTATFSISPDPFPVTNYDLQMPSSSFDSTCKTNLSTPIHSEHSSFSTAASSAMDYGQNGHSYDNYLPASTYTYPENASSSTSMMFQDEVSPGYQSYPTRPVWIFSQDQKGHPSPGRGLVTYPYSPQQPSQWSGERIGHYQWSNFEPAAGPDFQHHANQLTMPWAHQLGMLNGEFSGLSNNHMNVFNQSFDLAGLNANLIPGSQVDLMGVDEATPAISPSSRPATNSQDAFSTYEGHDGNNPYRNKTALLVDDLLDFSGH